MALNYATKTLRNSSHLTGQPSGDKVGYWQVTLKHTHQRGFKYVAEPTHRRPG
jgi:hypothetical protein